MSAIGKKPHASRVKFNQGLQAAIHAIERCVSDHPREQFGDGFATLLDNEKDFDLLLNVHFNLKAFCSNDSLSLLRIDPAEMIKYSQLSLLQKHKFACSSLNQSVNNEFGGADPLQ